MVGHLAVTIGVTLMRGHLRFIASWLGLASLVAFSSQAAASEKLTQADIPSGVSFRLRAAMEKTLSPVGKGRAAAAKDLGAMREDAAPAIPFLISLLDEDSELVNDAASDALVRIGRSAVGPCISALLAPRSVHQQAQLELTLGRIADPAAVEALIQLLDSSSPKIRLKAVYSLGDATDPRAVLPLIGAIKDRDEEVQHEAIRYFSKHRDSRAVEPLREVLKSTRDKFSGIRFEAARALGQQLDHRAVPDLLEVVTNAKDDACVRRLAAESLGQIGDTGVVDTLIAILQDRAEPEEVRIGVGSGLEHLLNRGATKLLLPVLTDVREPAGLRIWAGRAVARLEGQRALAIFSEVAKTPGGRDLVPTFRRWRGEFPANFVSGERNPEEDRARRSEPFVPRLLDKTAGTARGGETARKISKKLRRLHST